jgi:hypothetical protein
MRQAFGTVKAGIVDPDLPAEVEHDRSNKLIARETASSAAAFWHVAIARATISLHSGPCPTTSNGQRARGFAMSTGPNRILDEFAKLMTDAAGAAQGVRREVETAVQARRPSGR